MSLTQPGLFLDEGRVANLCLLLIPTSFNVGPLISRSVWSDSRLVADIPESLVNTAEPSLIGWEHHRKLPARHFKAG